MSSFSSLLAEETHEISFILRRLDSVSGHQHRILIHQIFIVPVLSFVSSSSDIYNFMFSSSDGLVLESCLTEKLVFVQLLLHIQDIHIPIGFGFKLKTPCENKMKKLGNVIPHFQCSVGKQNVAAYMPFQVLMQIHQSAHVHAYDWNVLLLNPKWAYVGKSHIVLN